MLHTPVHASSLLDEWSAAANAHLLPNTLLASAGVTAAAAAAGRSRLLLQDDTTLTFAEANAIEVKALKAVKNGDQKERNIQIMINVSCGVAVVRCRALCYY